MCIYYFTEETSFKLQKKGQISRWLQLVIQQEGYALNHLNFIFCSDNYLYNYNITYLAHDTLTDVITFDYATEPKTILGDIYISIERVNENANTYQRNPLEELYIVMVHGLLHLLGYKDDTSKAKVIIRAKESLYVNQLYAMLTKQ